jgi:hypothetical protein
VNPYIRLTIRHPAPPFGYPWSRFGFLLFSLSSMSAPRASILAPRGSLWQCGLQFLHRGDGKEVTFTSGVASWGVSEVTPACRATSWGVSEVTLAFRVTSWGVSEVTLAFRVASWGVAEVTLAFRVTSGRVSEVTRTGRVTSWGVSEVTRAFRVTLWSVSEATRVLYTWTCCRHTRQYCCAEL